MTRYDVIRERLSVLLEYLLIMEENGMYKQHEVDFFLYLSEQMMQETKKLLTPVIIND